MTGDFMKELKRRVILFDGGMGSMLISAGLKRGDPPERWVMEREDQILAVHAAYIEAGADVIQSATFGANRINLESGRGSEELNPEEVNRRAAELLRTAIDGSGRDIYAAGDIGPTGEFFPPVGTLDEKDALECFREQARALAEGGADLLLIETMSDLREAVTALRAAREVSDLPVIVEGTFQRKGKGYYTIMGDTPEKAFEILRREGADMAGANCTLDSGGMIGLAERAIPGAGLPLIFQPNAGQPVMDDEAPAYLQEPEDFASDIEKIIELGADAVGGCCGTSPDFIREVRRRILKRGGVIE